MIEEAFISGQLGKAIYADGGRYFILDTNLPEPLECRPMDFSAFFSFGAEVRSFSPEVRIDLVSLRRHLEDQRKSHHTLLLVVSGMDGLLDVDTRLAMIEEAEQLMKEDQPHRFVRSRMLSRSLSDDADLVAARALSMRVNALLVGSLYQSLIDDADSIAAVQENWKETVCDYFPSLEDQADLTRELIDLGAFSDVTSALVTGDLKAINSLVVTYASMPEVKRFLPHAALLLNDFRARLVTKGNVSLPVGRIARSQKLERDYEEAKSNDELNEVLLSRFKNRRDNPRSRRFKPDQAKEKVDHQIEAISNLIIQGNVNLANRYLSDLIRFHVEHSEREHLGMSLCSLAKIATDRRLFELAEKLVNYALGLGISDVVIPTTQAQICKSKGEFERARALYEETLLQFPNDGVLRTGYAELLKTMGEFDKGRSVYEETLERFPNDEVVRTGYAELLKAMGEFEKALEVYEETLARFPNNEVVRSGYAEVLKAMGEFEKARSVYEETLERFPNDKVVHTGYAELLKTIGEFDKALVVYEETLERFPNDQIARNGYAELLKSMGEFDKALVVYEETLERFPNDEVVRTGYAELLKAMGEFEKALEVYEETLARFPNNEVVRNGYAELLKAIGAFDKGLVVYEETLERFPNNYVARGGYAELLKAMGEFDKALLVYEEALERFPNNAVIRNGYASVLVQAGRMKEARLLLPLVRVKSKDDWVAYHVIAMSYLREGDTDEAIRRFAYGLQHTPLATVRTYFANALALAKIKKRDFADVRRILPTNVSNIDMIQKQTRLALVGHSQAALGKTDEATQLVADLESARNPRVINLKDALTRRYKLGKEYQAPLSARERRMLDARIDEHEYALTQAA